MTPEQEEKLGAAMLALTKRERKQGSTTLGGPRSGFVIPQAAAKANGKLGGRPRKDTQPRQLTERARTINRMLQRGMDAEEIADILGTTRARIHDAVVKYRLPRDEGA